MWMVGLTGGMGCGKSTVAQALAQRGIPIVDADEVARAVVEPGSPTLAKLVSEFGRGLLREDGSLDRQGLAKLAFAAPERRKVLESITHPAIASETARRFVALAKAGAPLVVYDAPLLFEAKRESAVNEVVVVTADPDVQLARILARGGITKDDALARIAAQLPLDEKARRADWIIDNSGDEATLLRQVERLLERWRDNGHLPSPAAVR
jgi:dephospho-CoA kinase